MKVSIAFLIVQSNISQWRGDRGRETGSKGGGKCAGDGKEGARSGKREAGFPRWREAGEKGKNYTIFHNRKNAKRQEPTNTGWEPGLKGTGSGRFKHPPPPPPPPPPGKGQATAKKGPTFPDTSHFHINGPF